MHLGEREGDVRVRLIPRGIVCALQLLMLLLPAV
jgi:hypothetical protein